MAQDPSAASPSRVAWVGRLALVASLGLALLRLWPGALPSLLVSVEGQAEWAIFASWVGLLVAAWARERRVVLGILAAQWVLVPWLVEGCLPRSATPRPRGDSPRLRVLSANLLAPRPSPQFVADLDDYDADIVALQEVSSEWWQLLEARGVLERYPHHVEEPHPTAADYFGIAVLSRLPLARSGIERLGAENVPLAWVELERGECRVRVTSVHTVPPFPLGLNELHQAQIDMLEARLRTEPEADLEVLVGDFNVSPMSRGYRRLRELAAPAHELAGRPFAWTWPNFVFLAPPMRLDHAFLRGSAPFEVISVREGASRSSDHSPILVELRIGALSR